MENLILNAKDITPVVDNYLCHSCGACSNVCPTDVISYKTDTIGHTFPVIDYDGCIDCTLCFKICPGVNFGKTLTSLIEEEDPFEGKEISSWVGQSKDMEIMKNSQSGGVTSSIILKALEDKTIDVAIVAVMSYENGCPNGDVILAYDKNDILESQKSKYIPIPLLTAITKVKEKKERFAIVGLSCHIHGLTNIMDKQRKVRDLYVFSLGLICDRVMLKSSMDFLTEKANVKEEKINEFYFRDKEPKGYPGTVHIKTDNNSYLLDAKERMNIKDFFTPARCRICFDKMNIASDITIGDPHGIDNIDREGGESLVVLRTEMGKKIYDSSLEDLNMKETSYQLALTGQSIDKNKKEWRTFIEEFKEMQNVVPNYYYMLNEKLSIDHKNRNKISQLLKHSLSLKKFKNLDDIKKEVYISSRKNAIIKLLMLPSRAIKKIFKIIKNKGKN